MILKLGFDLGKRVELWGFEPQASCMPYSGNTSTAVHLCRSPSHDVGLSPPESRPVAVLSCCTALGNSPVTPVALQLRSGRWRLSTICPVSRSTSDGGPAVTGYHPMTLAALAGRPAGRDGRWQGAVETGVG